MLDNSKERVRQVGDTREQISKRFKAIGYSYVTLDLDGFRSGSMNEVLSKSMMDTAKKTTKQSGQ